MACDRFLELLSARLDGALTEDEARELEAHLLSCPQCRAAGAQMSALQSAFRELEESPAPEGFTQNVMDRIRKAEKQKVIPLFRRPGFRAAACLAACLALAAGLYAHNSGVERDGAAPQARVGEAYGSDSGADVPQIAAYAAPEAPAGTAGDAERKLEAASYSADQPEGIAVTLDRLPEGAEELIPPETAVSPAGDGGTAYRGLSREAIDQIGRLAAEQGIGVAVHPTQEECLLIVLAG